MNEKNKKLLKKIKKENYSNTLKRHKRKKYTELTIFFSIIFLIILIIIFMFSPYVKLKDISVTGIKQINKEELLNSIGINESVKTWTIDDNELEKEIKNKYNIVKDVHVKSKMLSTLNIEIEEYKIIAKNKDDSGNYEYILSNGDEYTGNIEDNYNVPILESFQEDLSKKNAVYKNLSELREDVLIQISEIVNNKESDSEITIYMNDGQKIKALSSSFSEKLNYYKQIASFIQDKKNTILNLINGSYLETENTKKESEKKVKEILNISNGISKSTANSSDDDTVTKSSKSNNVVDNDNATTNSSNVKSKKVLSSAVAEEDVQVKNTNKNN